MQRYGRVILICLIALPGLSHSARVRSKIAEASPDEVSHWSGTYGDTNHPGCPRMIKFVGGSKENVEITGHDGDETRPWKGTGKVINQKTIIIDLSSKGGPSELEGQWSGTGIRWVRDGDTKLDVDDEDNWPKEQKASKDSIVPNQKGQGGRIAELKAKLNIPMPGTTSGGNDALTSKITRMGGVAMPGMGGIRLPGLANKDPPKKKDEHVDTSSTTEEHDAQEDGNRLSIAELKKRLGGINIPLPGMATGLKQIREQKQGEDGNDAQIETDDTGGHTPLGQLEFARPKLPPGRRPPTRPHWKKPTSEETD